MYRIKISAFRVFGFYSLRANFEIDTLKFQVRRFSHRQSGKDSSTGNCTAGTTYSRFVCQAGTSSINPFTGTAVACSGTSQTGEDHVFAYISTASTSTGGSSSNNAFQPPTSIGDSAHGLNLSSAIDATKGGGTFIFNTDGKVDGGQNPCDLQPPTFSFRSR